MNKVNNNIIDNSFILGKFTYNEVVILNAGTFKNFITGFILENGVLPVAVIGVPYDFDSSITPLQIKYNGEDKSFFYNGSDYNTIINTEFSVVAYNESFYNSPTFIDSYKLVLQARRKKKEEIRILEKK